MGGLKHSRPPSPQRPLPSPQCTITCLPSPSHTLILLDSPRNRQGESSDETVICSQLPPQTQETETMQLSREQVKQQLHKHSIVQARFCSCPLTWHLRDDSTGSTGQFISTGSVSQYSQSSAQATSKQFDEVKNNSY